MHEPVSVSVLYIWLLVGGDVCGSYRTCSRTSLAGGRTSLGRTLKSCGLTPSLSLSVSLFFIVFLFLYLCIFLSLSLYFLCVDENVIYHLPAW